jgi:hypothetical protein
MDVDEQGRLWSSASSNRSPVGLRLTEEGELVEDEAFGEGRSFSAGG